MEKGVRPDRGASDSFEIPGGVYDRIRDDIVCGRLQSNQRLKVGDLAKVYQTSTNPIREALQQLRGEGLVLIEPNRGARVRPIDEDFIRDLVEVRVLIEPALTSWFVTIANTEDIQRLESIQVEMEKLNFADRIEHGRLDSKFHGLIYDRHYNRQAAELCRHRELMRSIGRKFPNPLTRRTAVFQEHRELIDRIRAGDAAGASAVIARHVDGAGRHLIEQMSVSRRMAGAAT
jgi:DNA-binding GntR family transcriptional regulator